MIILKTMFIVRQISNFIRNLLILEILLEIY